MKPTRFYSARQEKQVAKEVSGKVVSNSGATTFSKGDVKSNLFLIECKTKATDSKSISIKREWLDKLKEEAFAMNRPYYALAFDFGDNVNHYIIDTRTFKLLNELLEREETK